MIDFTDDPELNELLNKVRIQTLEDVYKKLPIFLLSLQTHTTKIVQLRDQFYVDNPDLIPHKHLVSQSVATLERHNHDMPVEEMFARAAAAVRSALTLKGDLNEGQGQRPVRSTEPPSEPLGAHIARLISDDGTAPKET